MHILTYPMLTQFRSAMHLASIPYMANMQMFFLIRGIASSSAISLHIGSAESISADVIALKICLRSEVDPLMTSPLFRSTDLGDADWFQISLISRYWLPAVMLNSLVSIFILFHIWSKLQKYNKNLPERNAPADKSLMSNFYITISSLPIRTACTAYIGKEDRSRCL